ASCLLLSDGAGVRLEAHLGAREVNGHAEVAQEVAAENAALLEAAGLVDGLEIENQSAQVVLPEVGDATVAQEEQLDVVGDAGGADDTGALPLYDAVAHLQAFDSDHRNRRRTGARIEDHVDR